MQIKEILEGSDNVIKENINILAAEYLKLTGLKVCKSCPSSISSMLKILKYNIMSKKYKFKKPIARYKIVGGKESKNNSSITDEWAERFLKQNPERISLFSEYPKDWKKLIAQTKEQRENRMAVEAEIENSSNVTIEKTNVLSKDEEIEVLEARLSVLKNDDKSKPLESKGEKKDEIETTTEDEANEALNEASKASLPAKEELLRTSLATLRAEYKHISAKTVKDFVEKLLA